MRMKMISGDVDYTSYGGLFYWIEGEDIHVVNLENLEYLDVNIYPTCHATRMYNCYVLCPEMAVKPLKYLVTYEIFDKDGFQLEYNDAIQAGMRVLGMDDDAAESLESSIEALVAYQGLNDEVVYSSSIRRLENYLHKRFP